ncbi:conserved unknown protein [Ectocarpus siliculosus]|uniref:DRTGG domain-containing protein n=1 Tax=Ectocarpus siliculosus TaxID=2880 RepID=D7FP85_ECTSI|nr:conserved unknown protein [Ectocarpus siliculosus]|eukprot:CBJ30346.1 conserved unknown protein [Ectocarpus siliculosus]
MKEFFDLKCRYEDMSPVLIPAGYTRDYIDGKITAGDQLKDVHTAFQNVMDESDVVVLEGTGHTAVGSVVDLNNAQVAKALNADMILVANGGLGSAYDELELNRGICEKYGIKVRGVVLNKVVPGKLQMVKEYFGKLLKSASWGGGCRRIHGAPEIQQAIAGARWGSSTPPPLQEELHPAVA